MYDDTTQLSSDYELGRGARNKEDVKFLAEIIETSSTTSLKHSRPQRLIEWPEFMEMRCRVAEQNLKEELRNEAKLRIYGFVPSIPLYSFDFEEDSREQLLLERPALSDVKALHFNDYIEYVHELGFDCFIDRAGLTAEEEDRDYRPLVTLLNFKIYEFTYFNDIGAPPSKRQSPGPVEWTLYVLLPGQSPPDFNSFSVPDDATQLSSADQIEDTTEDCDETDFLTEIVETSFQISLEHSKPQNMIEWPEFMEMRCQSAKSRLKEQLRDEAILKIHGFVSSIPLYPFDFKQRSEKYSRMERPALSDIKTRHFNDYIEYVHDLGFTCFIDKAGLTSLAAGEGKDSLPLVTLLGFEMYEFEYFDSIGAPQSKRQSPGPVEWTLYVLLPEQSPPDFLVIHPPKRNRVASGANFLLLALLQTSKILVVFLAGAMTAFFLLIEFDPLYRERAEEAVLNVMPEKTLNDE